MDIFNKMSAKMEFSGSVYQQMMLQLSIIAKITIPADHDLKS